MKRLILSFFLIAGIGSLLSAQSFRNAGSTGMQFLKIGVGARAMGMAGTYTAFDGDAISLAWNPAGIGSINSPQISVQHTAWVAGVNHDFIGLVIPLNDQFNFGLHTTYLTSGKIEITTIDNPDGTGEFYETSDIAAGITASIRLTSQLIFAGTVNYMQEKIYDMSSSGIALDAGMWYATGFRSLKIGFSLSNLGFDQTFFGRQLEVRYDPNNQTENPIKAELQARPFALPLDFRAGGMFDVFDMFAERLESANLLLSTEFIQHSDTQEQFALGAEYNWQKMFSVRSGYVINSEELSWSAGVGCEVQLANIGITFDYSANALGRFGIGQRLGISLSFD